MKKSILRRLFGYTIIVLFIGLAVWYVYSNWSDFTSISLTQPSFLIPVIIFTLINIYAGGVLVDLTIEPHGVKLGKKEAFGLANVTRFLNQIAPTYVAATVRASYMKRVHKVSYTRFSSSFVVSNMLQFLMSGLFVIITFFLLVSGDTDWQPIIIVSLASITFLALLLIPSSFFARIVASLQKKFSSKKMQSLFLRLQGLIDAYEVIRKYPKLLPHMIIWMLVATFSIAAVYYFLYYSIGFDISIIDSLFIASLSGWAILFAITPGNLGVREGLMVVAAQIAGVSIAATLVVAVVLRLVMLAVPGVFSLIYMPKFMKNRADN